MKRTFILLGLVFLLQACISPGAQNTTPIQASPPSLFTKTPGFKTTPIELTYTPISISILTATPTLTAQSSETPASTPSVTESAPPTAGISVEPEPTRELTEANLPGKIYAWSIPFYGYLEPNQRFQESITRVGTQFPQEETPEKAITVAFSNYTQQIAYILETEEQKINFWLADLQLQNPVSVWTDEENLVGYSSGDIWLWVRWGPGDQFIVLENISLSGPNEGDYFWVVYSLASNTATSLSGACTYLFDSPKSGEFAVGCPTSGTGFIVLEQDGTQWNANALPEDSIFAKDWVFSPDGKRVLYANEGDEIFVVNKATEQIKLPVSYQWGSPGFVMQTLQWSQNGARLLIFGDNLHHCPYSTFAERTPPCWQVFDPTTGDVIWQEKDATGLIATLSPDGQWVVMFHADYAVSPIARWGTVYSIKDNSALRIYNWAVSAVSWGE